MKTYGETRNSIWRDGNCTDAAGWGGRKTRKTSRRRASDKKLLHREARRTSKHKLKNENE